MRSTLNTSLCKVWELRINNLWSIMRMYPNLVIDMMDHVRNRVSQEGREAVFD